jgi:segregation and condensation protein A
MKPELKLVEDTGSQLEHDAFDPPPQQAEMPFAIVDGEPVTEMPKDLYIPPDALQVFLEAFEGPLDLLLYMIRRQNIDILDIPIAEITRQYMQYIEVMTELQLELAGEYLLMAAMLAEIKSRMLLPRPPAAEGQEEEDPRAELVRRLQEYERFKKAAEDLDQLPRLERDTVMATVELTERKVVKIQPEVSLKEMLLAFRDVLQRADMFAHHHIKREPLSIRQRMSDILGTLRDQAFLEFVHLFKPEEGRMGVTVTFIAVLQLMKDGLVEIVQAEPYAPIHVRPATSARHEAAAAESAAALADADAENEAALAQPALPDEDEDYVEPDDFEATHEDDAEAAEAEADSVEADAPATTDEAASGADVESLSDEQFEFADADAENQAALAQPAPPEDDDEDFEGEDFEVTDQDALEPASTNEAEAHGVAADAFASAEEAASEAAVELPSDAVSDDAAQVAAVEVEDASSGPRVDPIDDSLADERVEVAATDEVADMASADTHSESTDESLIEQAEALADHADADVAAAEEALASNATEDFTNESDNEQTVAVIDAQAEDSLQGGSGESADIDAGEERSDIDVAAGASESSADDTVTGATEDDETTGQGQ